MKGLEFCIWDCSYNQKFYIANFNPLECRPLGLVNPSYFILFVESLVNDIIDYIYLNFRTVIYMSRQEDAFGIILA